MCPKCKARKLAHEMRSSDPVNRLVTLILALSTGCVPTRPNEAPDAGRGHHDAGVSADADAAVAALPKTCREALSLGTANDGPVMIDPDGPGGNPEMTVYCDMTTAG